MDDKYYYYGAKEVSEPPDEERRSFWEKHPELFMTVFLGGLTGLGILASIASIELIGFVTARKVVKKLRKEAVTNVV